MDRLPQVEIEKVEEDMKKKKLIKK